MQDCDLNPFLRLLGVELLEAQAGRALLALEVREEHNNSWAIPHGGVLMSLLDVAMAWAGRTLREDRCGVVTVEMNTQFFQSAGRIGDRLQVYGKANHQSATMCFCESEIWNGTRLIAKGTGTFKYLKKLRHQAHKPVCGSD